MTTVYDPGDLTFYDPKYKETLNIGKNRYQRTWIIKGSIEISLTELKSLADYLNDVIKYETEINKGN